MTLKPPLTLILNDRPGDGDRTVIMVPENLALPSEHSYQDAWPRGDQDQPADLTRSRTNRGWKISKAGK